MVSNKMSFEYFTSVVMSGNYRDMRKYKYLVKTMLEIVAVDEVKAFYPKHLFSENQPLESYVFTDNKLLIFYDTEEKVKVETLRYDQIRNAILQQEKTEFPNKFVKISFSTGEEIEFDPIVDSNSSWVDKFNENATEIYKVICNAPL